MKIKWGLKMWSRNSNLLEEATDLIDSGIFQYIELMTIPNLSIEPFLNYDADYIVHVPHEEYGFDLGKKQQSNYRILEESIGYANELNAKYIIIHPGSDSMNYALDFLNKINDDRIAIENMPKIGDFKGLNLKMNGHSIPEMQKLINNKFGFCFDIAHAIKASMSLGIEYKSFLSDFIKLKPKMYHLSDGRFDNERDEHLNIGEGDFDFNYILKLINKQNIPTYITLETPRLNRNSLKEDIINLEHLILK